MNQKSCSDRLFTLRFGAIKGFVKELFFLEYIMRQYIRSVTKFGNFWTVFRYSSVLVFLSMLVTFSGGLGPKIKLLNAIEVIGIWTICEFGVSRSIMAAKRYVNVTSRLGISLKSLVFCCFMGAWIEILTLLVFCNIVMFITKKTLLFPSDYIEIFFALGSLTLLFLPITYALATKSTKNSDIRFIVAPIFRILILSTPLFSSYHLEFSILTKVVSFFPTNFSFVEILTFLNYSQVTLISYIFTCALVWLLWFIPSPLVKLSFWIIEDKK